MTQGESLDAGSERRQHGAEARHSSNEHRRQAQADKGAYESEPIRCQPREQRHERARLRASQPLARGYVRANNFHANRRLKLQWRVEVLRHNVGVHLLAEAGAARCSQSGATTG